jgi:oxalate decarboxylase/phosphoglucose isomerase-like protein (cupin superfamily)
MPIDVVAKNFGIPAEHFANLPPKEKYIFPLPVPPPLEEVLAKLPRQRPPRPFTVHGGDFTPRQWDGGKTTIIDVGYVPKTLAHYIENIGSTKVRLLNVFNKPEYKDVALNQWLALTPPDLVRGHLNLDDTAMAALNPNERAVVR